MMAQFVMLNMFILIVLQQFDYFYLNENNPMKNFKEDVDKFKQAWINYTAKYEGIRIKDKDLLPFFASLETPLGTDSERYWHLI